MIPHLLTIEGLHVSYSTREGDVPAVVDVSLFLQQGECVGLVGGSGCGKTTVALAARRKFKAPFPLTVSVPLGPPSRPPAGVLAQGVPVSPPRHRTPSPRRAAGRAPGRPHAGRRTADAPVMPGARGQAADLGQPPARL